MELTDVWNKGWELWDKHGLLFLFVISVVFILVMAIVRRNETGSYYKYDIQRTSDKTRRAPSTDSKGEVECRRVLEKLTGVSFGKDRSEKMRNNVTGHDLELDCVNYDLRLACECGRPETNGLEVFPPDTANAIIPYQTSPVLVDVKDTTSLVNTEGAIAYHS